MQDLHEVKEDPVPLAVEIIPVIPPQLTDASFEVDYREISSGTYFRPQIQPIVVATVNELKCHNILASGSWTVGEELTVSMVVWTVFVKDAPSLRCHADMKLFQAVYAEFCVIRGSFSPSSSPPSSSSMIRPLHPS